MHIPFTKDKDHSEARHVIGIIDHTRGAESSNEVEDDSVEDPSPSIEDRDAPPILERPSIASQAHAIEVASGLIDVLYENQRGSFLCGIPLFSAAGLWVTDPHAWTAIDHKYTPFNIFNATLPDPTWEWVWKRWFVDMSGDVDENGWTYNLNFTKHHWHGHHIWYHSFVRRRRWLRKRRRLLQADRSARKQKNPAEDYTTIYSSLYRSQSQSYRGGIDSVLAGNHGQQQDDDDEDEIILENLGQFYQRLRQARLDREKLDAVDNYLHHGKDLEALAGEMRHILRFMIFQESRRQLLTLLSQRCQSLEIEHGVQSPTNEHGNTDHQCVRDAIDMADLLVNKLDYFSDRERAARDEEDAEMERIIAVRLASFKQRQQTSKTRSTSEDDEKRDTFESVTSLDSSKTTATTTTRPVKPNNERRVSFMDEQGNEEKGHEQESRYTKDEKGKAREH